MTMDTSMWDLDQPTVEVFPGRKEVNPVEIKEEVIGPKLVTFKELEPGNVVRAYRNGSVRKLSAFYMIVIDATTARRLLRLKDYVLTRSSAWDSYDTFEIVNAALTITPP